MQLHCSRRKKKNVGLSCNNVHLFCILLFCPGNNKRISRGLVTVHYLLLRGYGYTNVTESVGPWITD